MGWLQNWENAKRIPITIDSNKVDSNLSDFPVLIMLSSGTGINNADLTSVFDELSETIEFEVNFREKRYWENGYHPNMTFSKPTGSSVKVYSDVGGYGMLIAFVPVPKSLLEDNRKIKYTWEGTASDTFSNAEWRCRIYDGFYDRSSDDDFPDAAGFFTTKGAGLLQSIEYIASKTGFASHTTTETIDVSSSTRDYVSIFWYAMDGWNADSVEFILSSIQILESDDTLVCEMDLSGSISQEQSGTYKDYAVIGSSFLCDYNKKIAVTTSDGTTQCPVEIERWDGVNEEAELWTKIPSISSGEDTEFYLYYGNSQADNTSYIGTIGSAVGKTVWDSNYVAVYHMCQDPSGGSGCIKDSTSNLNHGTPGSDVGSGDLVDGKVGKGINFDGAANDHIVLGTNAVFNISGALTIEACINVDSYPAGEFYTVEKMGGSGNRGYTLYVNNNGSIWFRNYISNVEKSTVTDAELINTDEWYHLVGTRESGNQHVYIDGILKKSSSHSGTFDVSSTETSMAEGYSSGGAGTDQNDGILDEIRISNIVRPPEWVKAIYYSNWDNLITFGEEEGTITSPNTNQIIHGNPYYNASSDGVEIYDSDISTDYAIAYVTYSGGINTISLYDEKLYMGTNDAGIWCLPTNTITGTNLYHPDNLTPYISQFKDYPDITDSYVKYIHSGGDYMCVVTDVGLDHFNFGSSDSYYRSYATISGAEKCWQTSTGRFYYTEPNSLNAIYTYMCDWNENSVGYKYLTTGSGNLFFPEGIEINDISIVEGMSIHTTRKGATNNVLFVATTSGVVIIEEKQGDEENSRYKQYFVGNSTCSGNECSVLKGTSTNFVGVTSEIDSTFYNTKFACVSYGDGAGLNVIENDEVRLFWPDIDTNASDLTSVR